MSEAQRGSGGRRNLLKALVGGGSAAFACALAAPAAVFVAAPAMRAGDSGQRWVKTVKLETLRPGEPKKVAIVADERDAWTRTKDVELGAVWLLRSGEGVVALSTTCPHLGCSINRSPDGSGFGCPCHTSTFDGAGRRTGGPTPRDMDPLATRLDDGWVLVDFRRYRMSTADRVEIA